MIILSLVYTYYFSIHYPLAYTSRISLDAKIEFIKKHVDINAIDTIIVGSSIGLNNVQGLYLEKASKHVSRALNLSVYEASALQVEDLLKLSTVFPNLKRVVYSVQFSDFQHRSTFKEFDSRVIGEFMTDTLSQLKAVKFIFDAAKDLPVLLQRQLSWEEKHMKPYKFTYLGFDRTGSVPLHIYGKHIIKKRFNNPHGSKHINEPFLAVDRMSKRVTALGLKYYLVQQVYRPALIQKHSYIKAELNWFLKKVTTIVKRNGGYILSLYKTLPLDDKYFADRSHLNDKGSILSAEAIGNFIDKTEK